MNNSCKIVMYHYVRPLRKSKFPEIKGLELNGFIKQLEYFQNNFRIISMEQLLDSIYNQKELEPNSVLLTFDDGFKDHYQYVFHTLKEMQIYGSFFPSAQPITENIVLGVHKIHFILASCKVENLMDDLDELIEDNPDSIISDTVVSTRFDTYGVTYIKQILQRGLPKKKRNKILDILFRKYVTEDEKAFSNELYMSSDEIKTMVEDGMCFGSHGYSHEWMGFLTNKELESDLEKATEFLKAINNNKNSWIFCYPYGTYSQRVIDEVKRLGYRAGLSTNVGDVILGKDDVYSLNRWDTNDFPQ